MADLELLQELQTLAVESFFEENGSRILRSMLPDRWDCSDKNNCVANGIRSDGLTIRIPAFDLDEHDDSLLIKANKSLKISEIIPVMTNPGKSQPCATAVNGTQQSGLENVFYFEVFLISGKCTVGFAPKSPGMPQSFESFQNYHDKGRLIDGVGLDTDGNLYVAGARVGNANHDFRGGSIPTNSNDCMTWANSFKSGDTIGCGIVLNKSPRFFFTKNGGMINPGEVIQCSSIFNDNTQFFPAISVVASAETVLRTNFGSHPETPFLWHGNSRLRIISSLADEIAASPDDSFTDEQIFIPTTLGRGHTVPMGNLSRSNGELNDDVEHRLDRRHNTRRNSDNMRLSSSCVLSTSHTPLSSLLINQIEPSSESNRPTNKLTSSLVSFDTEAESHSILDVDDLKELSRELLGMAYAPDAHPEVLSSLIELCKSKLSQLNENVQRAMGSESSGLDLAELLRLHELVTDAIQAGEKTRGRLDIDCSYKTMDSMQMDLERISNIEFEEANQMFNTAKDVFSLLCHIRGHKRKRLDAALSLLSLAKMGGESACHEIISSGGMHSLLSVFKSSTQSPEVRKVSAITIAHLVPSLVSSNGQFSNSVSMDVMGCLRYLVQSPDDYTDIIMLSSPGDIRKALALAMTNLWINVLQPQWHSSSRIVSSGFTPLDLSGEVRFPSRQMRRRFSRRLSNSLTEEEVVDFSLTMEVFTSLSVLAAKIEYSKMVEDGELGAYCNFAMIIESICDIEYARPIAMEEGVISILVEWLQSGEVELERSAANALRNLTLSRHDYMAAWVHSQMLNENALAHVVNRLESSDSRIRLAVAEVISSVAVAPHTRAAIIDARGVKYLVQLLLSIDADARGENEALAIAAGKALLYLAAGAKSWTQVDSPFVATKKDCVVDDMIQNGALESFVAMAKADGKLRLLSAKLFCIVSEVSCSSHSFSHKLCEAGAVSAMGKILWNDVSVIRSFVESSFTSTSTSSDLINDFLTNDFQNSNNCGPLSVATDELRHVLRGIANVLGSPFRQDDKANEHVAQYMLSKACKQLISSGGAKGLLWIASMTPDVCSIVMNGAVDSHCFGDIRFDSCRALASLCSLLLTPTAGTDGATKWAPYVLSSLINILKHKTLIDDSSFTSGIFPDVRVDVLQGLCALAECEPLKTRIIDEFLPELLQLKQNEDKFLSDAAKNVCLALGFHEVSTSVACDAYLLGDKFSFGRCRILQAMARDEIRLLLHKIWAPPLSAILDEPLHGGDGNFCDGAELQRHLFHNLECDLDSADLRNEFSRQFMALYECLPTPKRVTSSGQRYQRTMLRSRSYLLQENLDDEIHAISPNGSTNYSVDDMNFRSLSQFLDELKSPGKDHDRFLQCHQYPMNGSEEERDWVVKHCQSLAESNFSFSTFSLPDRIQDMLEVHFPSALIQDEVLPVWDFRPASSFDFRALAMPSGRYFSFRREGQLIRRECEDLYKLFDRKIHCTLGFRNSSFAGEFVDSLIELLYLCPVLQGLAFTNDPPPNEIQSGIDTDEHEGSELLATLPGALPPSVGYLTFDNALSNKAASLLVSITSDPNRRFDLRALAITNSPHIDGSIFLSLIDSFCSFQYLRILDLSGNLIGDIASAKILSLALSSPTSLIERLDLSRNGIGEGAAVNGVLEECDFSASKLEVLNIAWNDLGIGDAATCLVTHLTGLLSELVSLDISGNNLADAFLNALGSSLSKNCRLVYLNVSHNQFSRSSTNSFLSRLYSLSKTDMTRYLSFIRMTGNIPPLAPNQELLLNEITSVNRQHVAAIHLNKHHNITTIDSTVLPYGSEVDQIETDELSSLSGGTLQTGRSSTKHPGIDQIAGNAASPPGMGNSLSRNMITVLFSAPLVWRDNQNNYFPIEMLDFDLEKSLLWQCFSEASVDIDLSFDNATTDRFQAVITKGCGCMHFSGHGHPNFLTFEDGLGGIHWLSVDQLKALISGGRDDGSPPFNFVFVSACHSALAGKTFVDSGVPHVVCCQQEAQLMDRGALAFTRAFYLALAVGKTVKDSFEIGKQAVSCSPTVPNPVQEMEKFMLLPEDGDHDVPIFNAERVADWPTSQAKKQGLLRNPPGRSTEESESVLPTPPQGFLGRETDMYYVLNLVLTRRFVNVVGPTGIGRSSLAAALCHYIDGRKSTMKFDHIYFVRSTMTRSGSERYSPITALYNQLESIGKIGPLPEEADLDETIQEILKSLRLTKTLLVFDRVETLEGSAEAQDLNFFLGQIFTDTKDVHVLMTSGKSVGLSAHVGVGENIYNLGPLSFRNTVKLFAYLCPLIHSPRERKELLDLLASDTENDRLSEGDENSRQIKAMLGGGIPAKTFSVAYQMTSDEFQVLKNLRANTPINENES